MTVTGLGCLAAQLEVSVVVAGEHEARSRAVLTGDWFELVDAPAKERIAFEDSVIDPRSRIAARFTELMRRVRDETYDR